MQAFTQFQNSKPLPSGVGRIPRQFYSWDRRCRWWPRVFCSRELLSRGHHDISRAFSAVLADMDQGIVQRRARLAPLGARVS